MKRIDLARQRFGKLVVTGYSHSKPVGLSGKKAFWDHRMMTYLGVQQMDDEMIAYHLDHMVEKVYQFKKAIKSSTTKEASDGKCDSGTSTKKSG
jgi:hypothetical protein